MGKSTINGHIFNSYVSLPEGNNHDDHMSPVSVFDLAEFLSADARINSTKNG